MEVFFHTKNYGSCFFCQTYFNLLIKEKILFSVLVKRYKKNYIFLKFLSVRITFCVNRKKYLFLFMRVILRIMEVS